MKKFKNAHGTVYEPATEAVEEMMLKDPRLAVVTAKKPASKPADKKPEAVADKAAASK